MSLPKYPQYKATDSKLVAEVPKDWQLLPLRRLLPVIESGTSVNALDNQPEEGKPSVLKTSCVYTSRFRPEECKEIVEEELGRATCPVKKDSLIVSRMNTPDLVGAAGLTDSDIEHLYLPDRLWQVRIGGLVPAFAYYWTQSNLYRDQVKAACSGTSSSMQNLSQEAFVSFFLCRPESEEQNQIASFLDRETAKIDALIAEQQRLIELLQEKRQAAISHAVTKGLNPNAPMKDSGVEWLGEVPEHWAILPLKHICRIERGKFSHRPRNDPAFYGGEYPFIQTGDITSAAKTIKTWTQTLNDRGASVSRSFKAGTIVVSIAANVGDVAILGIEAYFPDSIIGCQPEARVEQEFLYYLLRSAKSEISRSGSINTQANVNAEQLGGIVVCLPPLNEQQEIVDRLNEEESQRDKIAIACATAIQLLNERRSALISAAVTGQIDVRGLVTEAVEQ